MDVPPGCWNAATSIPGTVVPVVCPPLQPRLTGLDSSRSSRGECASGAIAVRAAASVCQGPPGPERPAPAPPAPGVPVPGPPAPEAPVPAPACPPGAVAPPGPDPAPPGPDPAPPGPDPAPPGTVAVTAEPTGTGGAEGA